MRWLLDLLLVAVAVLLFCALAWGHDAPAGWSYPWACCSSLDCRPVEAGAVSEKADGYLIEETGEVVAYADVRVKDSPDGEFHWCAHRAGIDAGRTVCLFVPPRGT